MQQPPTDVPSPERPIPARVIKLEDELRRVNLNNLGDFAFYGNAELKRAYEQADAFDRPSVVAKIRAEQANIVPKIFVTEYTYSVSDSDVNMFGDKSAFRSRIPSVESVGAVGNTIDIASFPVPNVIGKVSRASGSRASESAFARGTYSTYALELSVHGNTDSIRELVRNSNNYQVRVLFRIHYLRPQQPSLEQLAYLQAAEQREQRRMARGGGGTMGGLFSSQERAVMEAIQRAQQHSREVLFSDIQGTEIIRVDIVGKSGPN